MEPSIWDGTLTAFREKAGGTEPVPAGVSIAAVSASLALALLAKVLYITGRKKSFTGDREALQSLMGNVRSESEVLTRLADEDVEAFNQYMECVRQGLEVTEATRKTIEVPMNAARAVVRGLELCAAGVKMVHGLTAADLEIAAALLSGAVRAMVISVEANRREMDPGVEFSGEVAAECRALEAAALRHAEAVRAGLPG
jgi:formiminotetrahydrofolate cyclodeaminase